MTEHRCCASVHNDYGIGFHQCTRKGRIERDGKWYCGTHDPVRVAERDRVREAAYQAKRDEERKLWAKQAFDTAAGDLLRSLGISIEKARELLTRNN